MVSRAQKIRLAVFFVIGFSILSTIIISLLGSKFTEKRDNYYISFENTSVAGLQIGGAVLYRGIRIGRIDDIQIDSERIQDIIVQVSVKRGTPIKADQVATMVNIGITGLKQIELSGGTNEAPFLQAGSRILAGRSLFDNITDTAEILTAKLEIIVDNIIEITNQQNQQKFANILANIDVVVGDSQRPLVNTVANIEKISAELAVAMVSARDMMDKLNNALGADRVTRIAENTETVTNSLAQVDFTQINVTMERLNDTINRTNLAMSRIDSLIQKNSSDLSAAIQELRESLENLNEFTRLISEEPSLLIRSRRATD